MAMERVENPEQEMEWLASSPGYELVTGIEMDGWPASTWLLHTIYQDSMLPMDVTHDEVRRRGIELGVIEPEMVGDVNLDDGTTVIGATLGYPDYARDPRWTRISWRDAGAVFDGQEYPPSFHWFPDRSFPAALVGPSEGSLDGDELAALIDVLGRESGSGGGTECFAFMASLTTPDWDFDNLHLWRGTIADLPSLLEDNGGTYGFTPSNIWPADRSWFVWTDYDLWATKVSGSDALIAALQSDERFETVQWQRPPKQSNLVERLLKRLTGDGSE